MTGMLSMAQHFLQATSMTWHSCREAKALRMEAKASQTEAAQSLTTFLILIPPMSSIFLTRHWSNITTTEVLQTCWTAPCSSTVPRESQMVRVVLRTVNPLLTELRSLTAVTR